MSDVLQRGQIERQKLQN